ncbi:GNAT family N-acetyltransferase [Telluribacter sp.]|jgi:GNAT superfamily N-acetyltransferase|uniref:GNAT family N-acetyltransferase n=1 Tax=Telluribacter sp. TaxID=1978767 RepID=UPI002E0D21A9|nr:GNAT family N-acetyltransferase [Telluribacter sp.]
MQTQATTAVRLEKISVQEADALSALCLRLYPQFYLYLWYDAGEWYQRTRYNPEQLRTELSDPASEFYWIYQSEEGLPVGYLKINLKARPAESTELTDNGLELERIYLLKEATGTGLGAQVLAWVAERAAALRRDYVYLYTMDSSQAIRFYEKYGYRKAGVKRLPFEQMKPEYRGMYLMIKEL